MPAGKVQLFFSAIQRGCFGSGLSFTYFSVHKPCHVAMRKVAATMGTLVVQFLVGVQCTAMWHGVCFNCFSLFHFFWDDAEGWIGRALAYPLRNTCTWWNMRNHAKAMVPLNGNMLKTRKMTGWKSCCSGVLTTMFPGVLTPVFFFRKDWFFMSRVSSWLTNLCGSWLWNCLM